MKTIIKVFFPLFFLFSLTSRADDTMTFKYGLGFGVPQQVDVSEVKYISLGHSYSLNNTFRLKGDLGAWFDGSNNPSSHGSGFGSLSLGIRVTPGYFYVDNYFGIAYLTNTDLILGIPFEFTEELGIGVKDNEGRSVGVEYRHFSNAGISSINHGRDFFLINIGIEL
jgi:hypothetical protein